MSITMAMYARRKQWPLDAVTIRLRHSRIHAADCKQCGTAKALLGHIDCEVAFTGALTEQQWVRMLEIADKCLVHRTLTSEIRIRARPWP